MSERIHKTCQDLTLEITPALGGAISKLRYRNIDILRPLPEQPDAAVNQSGCFALLPYSNRINKGIFEFDDERIELAKNFGDHPHSIHGNAWQNVWKVMAQDEHSVTLIFEHTAQGEGKKQWPWPYRAVQKFTLSEDSLHVTLTYHNKADKTVPVGLGFHPYFANAKEALLRFSADKVVLNDEHKLPCATTDIPKNWCYQTHRKPEPETIDNCFIGWHSPSEIDWPCYKVKAQISSPDAHNAVLFIPPAEKNFVAIEPVTHINNAINDLPIHASEQAMKRVAPQESLSVTMMIKVSSYE